jgi:TPR repeat protein
MNYVKTLAEGNNPTAQCFLARLYYYGSYKYEYGKGDTYSEEWEASRWYQMAANSGEPEALCFIGKGYYEKAKKAYPNFGE